MGIRLNNLLQMGNKTNGSVESMSWATLQYWARVVIQWVDENVKICESVLSVGEFGSFQRAEWFCWLFHWNWPPSVSFPRTVYLNFQGPICKKVDFVISSPSYQIKALWDCRSGHTPSQRISIWLVFNCLTDWTFNTKGLFLIPKLTSTYWSQGDWQTMNATKLLWQLYKYPEDPNSVHQHLTIGPQTSVHLPASAAAASQGCRDLKKLRQATVTYNSSMATERIQSESPALGPDGQYLLHRVKSHGWRLIGKAMTDGLRDGKTDCIRESISIWISQRGCCFVKGCHTPDFFFFCGKQMVPDGWGKCDETQM